MTTERSIIKQEEHTTLSPALERLAEQISRSTIIPKEFAGSPANCLIALEMAHRIGAGVLQVMQSLYIVHGKPSWSGQFIIGAVNSTRRFSPLRFKFNDGMTECFAVAEDHDGNQLKGPTVSIDMAKKEGWWDRNPKWKNLTELMLMYRAGTFFGRVYAPDILMGMREQYEVLEAQAVEIKEPKIPTRTKDMIVEAAGGGLNEQKIGSVETAGSDHPSDEVSPAPARPVSKKKESSEELAFQSSATTPKRRLKVKAPLTAEKVIGPNRKALAERLALGNYTEADFLVVANHQEWLGRGKAWQSMDDVPDGMFEVFLAPEEFAVVMEQLDKFAAK